MTFSWSINKETKELYINLMALTKCSLNNADQHFFKKKLFIKSYKGHHL